MGSRLVAMCLAGLLAVGIMVATVSSPAVNNDAGQRRDAIAVAAPVRELLASAQLEKATVKVRELMLAHRDEPAVQQELYWLLGMIQLRTGHFEQAITAAEKLEELMRAHPPASASLRDRPITLRLQAYMALKRFDGAREAAKPLLARAESDPGLLRGLRYVAETYLAEKRPDEALKFLDERYKAAQSAGTKGNILLISADVRFRAGEKEAASQVLDRVAKEHPEMKSRAEAMRTAWKAAGSGCGCGTPTPPAQAACGGCGSAEAPPGNAPPPAGGCCGPAQPKQ